MAPQELKRFPIGLLLFAAGVLLYKAAVLSLDVSGQLWLMLRFAALDFTYLALTALAALWIARLRSALVWRLAVLVYLLIVFYYAIHSHVLLALDESMSVFDLGRYLPEWQVVASFLNITSVLLLLTLGLAAAWHTRRPRNRWFLSVFPLLLVTGIFWSLAAPRSLHKYGLLPIANLAEQWQTPETTRLYSVEDVDFYSQFRPPPAYIPEQRPDVILLIVESLSSINSIAASGVTDLMPAFDRLADKGTLFTRFFANHAASEGGIISMLSGFPPLHFPSASPLMFDEFAQQEPVIREYQNAGYFTEFLTNTDLAFIGMDRYFDGISLDQARGRDEVDAFIEAPRFVQHAPSDRYLYEEALKRVSQLNLEPKPWILTLATVSTHLPYTHPENGEDTAEALWTWSLDRLAEFVASLEEQGFFQDGLLLITGDHRQMRPLSDQEIERFGDTARARVPLLAIGEGMRADAVDTRLLQQSDLLRYLGRLQNENASLSPHALWVERYNRLYGRVESINRFRVFEETGQRIEAFDGRIVGSELDWPEERPASYRAVETSIHEQRSRHQATRGGTAAQCPEGGLVVDERQPGPPGMSVRLLANAGITDESVSWSSQAGYTNVDDWSLQVQAETGVVQALAWLEVLEAGTYWFRLPRGQAACLSIAGEIVLGQPAAVAMQGSVELSAGHHLMDLRVAVAVGETMSAPEWVIPGQQRWRWRPLPAVQMTPALATQIQATPAQGEEVRP